MIQNAAQTKSFNGEGRAVLYTHCRENEAKESWVRGRVESRDESSIQVKE
jgi:hypothetical protein